MKPAATLSIDVDPLDTHLEGYGVRDAPQDALVYERSLPRIRRLLDDTGLRATFFVVARDAEVQAPLLRALASDGHEVASHSWDHPTHFARLTSEAVAGELERSRDALSAASGSAIVGFRAPGWDWHRGLAAALSRVGYRYDASAFPSPLLGAARLLLFCRGLLSGERRPPHLQAGSWLGPRRPHALAHGTLQEFPVTVTRVLRVPVYHSLRYGVSDGRFARTLDRLVREGSPLSYPLHAVDALGLAEDRLDPRLAAHPGMRHSLDAKLALLRETLSCIATRFEVQTFRERLQPPAASGPGGNAQS